MGATRPVTSRNPRNLSFSACRNGTEQDMRTPLQRLRETNTEICANFQHNNLSSFTILEANTVTVQGVAQSSFRTPILLAALRKY